MPAVIDHMNAKVPGRGDGHYLAQDGILTAFHETLAARGPFDRSVSIACGVGRHERYR